MDLLKAASTSGPPTFEASTYDNLDATRQALVENYLDLLNEAPILELLPMQSRTFLSSSTAFDGVQHLLTLSLTPTRPSALKDLVEAFAARHRSGASLGFCGQPPTVARDNLAE